MVSELVIAQGDWLASAPIGELSLADEGVTVLGLERGEDPFRPPPIDSLWLEVGDMLVLFGHDQGLHELDHRPAGEEGDERHRAAVARQQSRMTRFPGVSDRNRGDADEADIPEADTPSR